MTDTEIKSWLLEVVHPAKGSQNIVQLGMVEAISVEGNRVAVTLAFPKRRDPLTEYLVGATRATIIRNAPKGTEVEVKTIVKDEAPKKKPGLDLGMEEINRDSLRQGRCRQIHRGRQPGGCLGQARL